jgi:hypothetical protein
MRVATMIWGRGQAMRGCDSSDLVELWTLIRAGGMYAKISSCSGQQFSSSIGSREMFSIRTPSRMKPTNPDGFTRIMAVERRKPMFVARPGRRQMTPRLERVSTHWWHIRNAMLAASQLPDAGRTIRQPVGW